jgi:predicted DCC family thiol-disulfide oxidoreductase YuxK
MGSPDPVIDNHSIILFDGVCNLCNSSVLFIIKRDPKARFYFAALQSDFGIAKLREYGISSVVPESVLLLEAGELCQKSTAALKIARNLSGLWPAIYVFIIVPKFLRDFIYDFIARNRYRWFGKKDACMIPTPALKARFVG